MKPVLVVGLSTQIGLNIVQSLGRRGVPVCGASGSRWDVGMCSRYLRRGFVIPLGPEEAFVEAVLRLVRGQGLPYLIAISERNMTALNRHRAALERHTRPLFPPQEVLQGVLDKERTRRTAERLGIPVPRSVLLDRPERLAQARELGFPLVLKPASRDWRNPHQAACDFRIRYVGSPAELEREYRRLAPLGYFPLAQELCEGEEVGLAVIMRGGRALAAFQYRQLLNSPPDGGVPVYRESMPLEPGLLAAVERLLGELGYEGVAEVDFITNRGERLLLEVNGRWWGSLPLAVRAGADFPWWFYQAFVEGRAPEVAPYRVGVRCRSLGGHTRATLALLFGRRRGPVSSRISRARALWEWLRALRPGVYLDVQCRDDPLPGLVDLLLMLRPWR